MLTKRAMKRSRIDESCSTLVGRWRRGASGNSSRCRNRKRLGLEQLEQRHLLAVVISEIMYHPSSEDSREEYIELHNSGSGTVSLLGWKFTDGIDYQFSDITMPSGSYLVVAADTAVFSSKYPAVTNVVGGWTGQLSNRGETIELRDNAGGVIDEVSYADQGDWAQRELRVDEFGEAGWEWVALHDGGDGSGSNGRSLELVQLAMPNNYGQNWLSSVGTGGSPGVANLRRDNDIAPLILDVAHDPPIPSSFDQVTVSARIQDEAVSGIGVTLFYRDDGQATFQTLTMRDDGRSNDGGAGDGVYAASVPARPDGTVVEFYVSATDSANQLRTWPAATNAGQIANAFYQVDNAFDLEAMQTPGNLLRMYQIMSARDRQDFAEINRQSDAEKNATWIVVDGTGVEVRYSAGVRLRGSASRAFDPPSNRINLPSDVPWNGVDQLNINASQPGNNANAARNHIAGSVLFRLAGLAVADGIGVRMLSNGEDLAGGAYAYLETPNSDFANHHFAEDPNGNLYRGRRTDESPPGSQGAGLRYFGTDPVAYGGYTKLTNASEADWSDVMDLTYALNNCGTDGSFEQCIGNAYPQDYLQVVSEVVNIDQWLRVLAMSALVDNDEVGLLTGDQTGDDYMMYRGVIDPRFEIVAHDLDSLFGSVTRSINRFEGVDSLDRLVNHPDVLPRYHAQLLDLIDNVILTDTADVTLRESLRGVATEAEVDSIVSFLNARAQYVRGLLPDELAIHVSLPVVGSYYQSTNSSVVLFGSTPAGKTRSLLVNGYPATSLPGDGTWSFVSSHSVGGAGNTTVELISRGAVWKYLDDGSDQGTAWRSTTFNDDSWDSGPAQLGYGDDDEATVVGFVDTDLNVAGDQRNATTYFRRSFSIDDPADVIGLTLSLLYDDAAVVYINGGEVARTSGLPAIPRYDDYSSSVIAGADERAFTEFVLPGSALSRLNSGTNTIAVEVHQSSINSSDMSFDLGLTAQIAEGGPATDGLVLQPGINRIFVEALDGPGGSGNRVASEFVDIWYAGDATATHADYRPAQIAAVDLQTRDSYMPGVPFVVRVDALDSAGRVARDVWEATAALVADNPHIRLSVDSIPLVNGIGSALVYATGIGDFSLTAFVGTHAETVTLRRLSADDAISIEGTLSSGTTDWSGIVHVTGDVTVPANATLNIHPGTLILMDGDPVGAENSTLITVRGRLNSLGMAESPISWTASEKDTIWGQIDFDGGVGDFAYSTIDRSGNAIRQGHTSSGAAIRMRSGASVNLANSTLTDLRGKPIYSSAGTLDVRDSLFTRMVMGPEIAATALQFHRNWIVDMAGIYHHAGVVDDNDGIYIHGQAAGQQVDLSGGVIAFVQDDGIDTLGPTASVRDYVVHDIFDKGLSLFEGSIDIDDVLITRSDIGISVKANDNASAIADINHATIAEVNKGIGAENKDGANPLALVSVTVQNSIVRVNEGGDAIFSDYAQQNVVVSYSNIQVAWPGMGNINVDPLFAHAARSNFRPLPGSPSIDAGHPSATDGDGTRADQGFYRDGFAGIAAPRTIAGGTLIQDTIMTPWGGPYHITASVTIAPGTRLVILPGTSLFFDADVEMIVLGELIAEGSAYSRIRLTSDPLAPPVADLPGLPAGPPRWDGVHFVSSRSDRNLVSHVDLEYAQDSDGAIGLLSSNAVIDSITVAGTHLRMIYGESASMLLQNSVFPDMFGPTEMPAALGLDNVSEHVKLIGQPPANGRLIIKNNLFGTNKGHNDVIDADSGRVPNPILQILDNVFLGAGDELLDLGGDVYVAGNVFTNVFKDDETSDRGYANVISTGDAGTDTTIVVARNYFIDVDHAINLKRGTATFFENNTVYRIHPDFVDRFGNPNVGAAITLFVDEPGGTPGRGAYVEGNIFWDLPRIFGDADRPLGTLSLLELHNNLIDPAVAQTTVGNRPGTILDLGSGNLVGAPRFVDELAKNFSLDVGSPARGAGPLGRDLGADIRDGIWIANEPEPMTDNRTARLTVGGPGIFAFQYRVDGGDWSATQVIPSQLDAQNGTQRTAEIVLQNLSAGTHFVEVIGQDFAGNWQQVPTRSASWTVGAALPLVRINEVLASNDAAYVHAGSTPDYIELYNDGTATIDLSGMALSDDLLEPRKFVFPAGTTLGAGQYLLLLADEADTGYSELFVEFSLNARGEGVYLFESLANGGALVDEVVFGRQLTDLSIGRIDRDAVWQLNQPTPGHANRGQPTASPQGLKINEWLADGDIRIDEDYIELYNDDELPVSLGGLYLSDNPNAEPLMSPIAPLSFIGPQGFASLVADGNPERGTDHVDFRLDPVHETIALYDSHAVLIDRVMYFGQFTDYSQGRFPDGGAEFIYSSLPTPELTNGRTSTTLTVLEWDWDEPWKYVDTGTDLGAAWRNRTYSDATWSTGVGPLGVESDPLPVDLTTTMNLGATTYYFRKHFNLIGDDLSSLHASFSTLIDDGAIVYVNGTEVRRLRMSAGEPTFDAVANETVGQAAIEGAFEIPANLLRPGDNVIAVEVHQASTSSSDVVFGLNLQITRQIDSATTVPQQVISGLRVSEIMYHPASNGSEYVELVNINSASLDISGVRLRGGIDITLPPVTLAPGERAVVVANVEQFLQTYGNGPRILGQYNGSLSDRGEEIVVQPAEPFDAAALRFDYQDAWYPSTDGNGMSLEIVDLNADDSSWRDATNWRASAVSGGTPGASSATLLPETSIVINEVLSHTDSPDVDSIELYNRGTQPIDVSGWYLSDSSSEYRKFRFPTGSVVAPGEYLVLDESDFNAGQGGNPLDFALDGAHGDQVWLWSATPDGMLDQVIDYVEFGAAAHGESWGKVPNGSYSGFGPLRQATLGKVNTHARTGTLVISELQYDAGAPSAAALAIDPNITATDLEFVEIYNSASTPRSLADWRIRGGVEYDFVSGRVLGGGQTLLVVPFALTGAQGATRLAAFRAHYGIGAAVSVVGGFAGRLDNEGDRVVLQRPDDPPLDEPTFTPRLTEDEAIFDDGETWPVISGDGRSLQRTSLPSYGGLSGAWRAAPASPGVAIFVRGVAGDLTGDGAVDSIDLDVLLVGVNSASPNPYYDLNEDSAIDLGDVRFVLESVLHTRMGDANLDGVVDAVDYGIWSAHRWQDECMTWGTGDFNGDGYVDGSDFNLWNQNKFVPAPASNAASRRVPRAALSRSELGAIAALRRLEQIARRQSWAALVQARQTIEDTKALDEYFEQLTANRR
jgi:hypothetical protein